MPERTHSHTGHICLLLFHSAFSNVSSHEWPERMHNHMDCICPTFPTVSFQMCPQMMFVCKHKVTLVTLVTRGLMPRKVLSNLSFIFTYSTADQDKHPPLQKKKSEKPVKEKLRKTQKSLWKKMLKNLWPWLILSWSDSTYQFQHQGNDNAWKYKSLNGSTKTNQTWFRTWEWRQSWEWSSLSEG